MPIARLLNGEADGDHVPIPDPPPWSLCIPRLKPLTLEWLTNPPALDDPASSLMEVDTYVLGINPTDGHVERDRRGRYYYWLKR